ncbi:MAG: hypothetical protein K940chlam7_00722 [Chlamydiae bacterium]|nr:hypothetical protein [Chlamydiota bacterium]
MGKRMRTRARCQLFIYDVYTKRKGAKTQRKILTLIDIAYTIQQTWGFLPLG